MIKAKTFLYILICMIILSTTVSGQQTKFDQGRMNRDLRIMESILNRLLKEKSEGWSIQCRTNGFYIPDYGIVFHSSQPRPTNQVAFFEIAKDMSKMRVDQEKIYNDMKGKKRSSESYKEIVQEIRANVDSIKKVAGLQAKKDYASQSQLIYSKAIDKYRNKTIDQEKKHVRDLKKNVLVFLKDYVKAIGQLNVKDRIAVIVNLEDWEISDHGDAFLTGWITKNMINQSFQKNSDGSDIEKNIRFLVSSKDSAISKDIDIMTEIIDRGIELSSFKGSASSRGIYINGLGAIFFLHIPISQFRRTGDSTSFSIIVQNDVENAIAYTYGVMGESKKSNFLEKKSEYVDKIKDEISDLLISYGHTIHLKQQDSIVLKVDLENRYFLWSEESCNPSYLIIQLKKKDLDAYNEGTISKTSIQKRLITYTN